MRKLLTLFLLASSVFAQQQVQPVSGVLTLNLIPGTSSFKVILSANVTSVVIQNPTPGTIISVIFTENATGGFTVAFGGNIANPCSVTTTANATTTCQFQYDATSNTWQGIGGGSSGGLAASGVIDTTATKYNTPIGNHIPDATFTSGQATIDCTFNNDCNFTAANVGNVCFGTNFTSDVSILNNTAVVLPEGTLTVTDAQHANCSGGNSTATTTHNGVFVWGKLGHTQLNSAWTDCLTQAASGGCNYQLPAGPVLVEAPVGITNPTNPAYIESQGYGKIHVRGWGASISQLLPTPNFSGAACVGGPITGVDNNGCFFSGTSINMSDWGIFGAGQATLPAAFNGKVGVIVSGQQPSGAGANSYLNSLDFFSWGALTSGFIGVKIEGQSDTTFHDVHLDGMGATGCQVNAGFSTTLTTFEGTYCAVNNGPSLSVGGWFTSHGGVYGLTAGAGGVGVGISCGGASSIASFYGDTAPYQAGASSGQILIQTGCTAYLNGMTVGNSNGQSSAVLIYNHGGTIYLRDTTIIPISGNPCFFMDGSGSTYSQGGNRCQGPNGTVMNNTVSTQSFFDEGFNTYTGGFSGTPIVNTGVIAGPNVIRGSCTGVVTSASTVGLYGAGQFSATTCTSTTVNLGQVMDRAGTVLGLTCTATAAGNQAADACTLVKNGVAQTMTCSLNGVTRCSDYAQAHNVTYVAGDVIGIEAIGGTSTTLAGVNGGAWRQ